ncbi:MAG TPA: exo-alpha-sialidase [Candidatus Kapabacteria bacterium]|nr:exo-alpha-sialidase [Candidatus Kapabacteria bacterium]
MSINFKILIAAALFDLFATIVFGQTFSTPIQVSTDSGAHSPAMHTGRDGTIYVSWFENNADIYFSHSTDAGTSFTPPVHVSKQVTTNNYTSLLQRAPNFAVDTKGVIHLVWMEARIPNAQSDIWYARSTDDGATWTPPQSIMDAGDSSRFAQDFPAIAIDSTNNLYVCYIDNRYLMRGLIPHYKLQLERSTDGGETWLNPVIADKLPFSDAGTCECCRDDIAVSPEGHVYIAFRTSMTEGTSDMRDIFIARSMDSGMTFDSSIQCQLGDWNLTDCPTKGPQIALDGNENLHVAWADARDDFSGKLVSYYSLLRRADTSVFPNYSISSGNLPYSEWPDVAIGPDGTIAYAYTVSGPNLFSYSSDGGNTWHRSLPLPGGSGDAQTIPALAFDPSGNLFVAWEDINNNGAIYFSKITSLQSAQASAAITLFNKDSYLTRTPLTLSWSRPVRLNAADFVWYNISLTAAGTSISETVRDTSFAFDSLPEGQYTLAVAAYSILGKLDSVSGIFSIQSPASVSEPEALEDEAYPDPVTNGVLAIETTESGKQLLTVVDSKGNIVKKVSLIPNGGRVELDVLGLPAGAYTCEIMGKPPRHIRFIIP